jgi:hypothetical protein
MNITMMSIQYHFVPHPVLNHLKIDKCLFLHTYFYIIFSSTLFEEIADRTNK